MQNISLEDLDLVTGGTLTATPTHNIGGSTNFGSGSGSSSSGSGNDALMTSLNSISSSIKDLSKKHNGGLFGGDGMLLFGMALAMRRNDSTVVVNGGGGYSHGSYSWHARW